MDVLSAVGSILAVATAGVQISIQLVAFANQISTAPQRIHDIGADVSITANTLQELSRLIKLYPTQLFSSKQLNNILDACSKCREIFDQLKKILAQASQQLRKSYEAHFPQPLKIETIFLTTAERMKWPFMQRSVDSLRSELRSTKETLTLVVQVAHLHYSHIAANASREQQEDMIRMIAAMKRRQTKPMFADGHKDVFVSQDDDVDPDQTSSTTIHRQMWSMTPNVSADTGQHFLLELLPVSEPLVLKAQEQSMQTAHELSSVLSLLSELERQTLYRYVLESANPNVMNPTFSSIVLKPWEGTHGVFGKVQGRRLDIIVQKEVRTSSNRRRSSHHRRQSHREEEMIDPPVTRRTRHDSQARINHENTANQRKERKAEPKGHKYQSSMPDFPPPSPNSTKFWSSGKSSHYSTDAGYEAEHPIISDEARFPEHLRSDQRSRPTFPSPYSAAPELSDEDVVRSLLTEFTTFDMSEPLLRSADNPPVGAEPDAVPERQRHPYVNRPDNTTRFN